MNSAVRYYLILLKNLALNFSDTSRFIWEKIRLLYSADNKVFQLTSKYARHPLLCRPDSSDNQVFFQIFIEREYASLDDLQNVDLVIDCGANVGYSSAYFLTQFSESRLIAIEPDSSNFAIMQENLKPYRERASLMQAGVWSHQTNLRISEVPFRDGKEWSIQVTECDPVDDEESDLMGIGIGDILQGLDADRVSILKIDIEGSEAVVFGENAESWLPYVDNIVIELHDDTFFGQCSEIFFRRISKHPFSVEKFGELVICKRQEEN